VESLFIDPEIVQRQRRKLELVRRHLHRITQLNELVMDYILVDVSERQGNCQTEVVANQLLHQRVVVDDHGFYFHPNKSHLFNVPASSCKANEFFLVHV